MSFGLQKLFGKWKERTRFEVPEGYGKSWWPCEDGRKENKKGYPHPSVLCRSTLLKYLLQQRYRDVIGPLLKYLLQQRCRDVIEPLWVSPSTKMSGCYIHKRNCFSSTCLCTRETTSLLHAISTRELALPSCHLRLALVILQSLAKYLLDGLRVQFQMYSRLCPWLFTWPDFEEFDEWRRS